MPDETEPDVPWRNATVVIGIIQQQGILFPLPVILECRGCGTEGYWHPGENRIHAFGAKCFISIDDKRDAHDWAVDSWNGHERRPDAPEISINLSPEQGTKP